MSLQLVLGNAGSGKSSYIYDALLRYAAERPDKTCFLIVPEQFTVSAEKELLSRLEGHAMMNISVLSFDRLAYQVFDELGTPLLDVLDDTGRSLLLRRVAQEHMEELTVLKGMITRPGYIDEVKSFLTELSQYHIGPDELEDMSREPGMGPAFVAKTHDLLILYRGLKEEIEGHFITAEDRLMKLADVIEDSDLIRGSLIAMDGFTGFTPLQNVLLERMMPMVSSMMVSVTIDTAGSYLTDPGEQDLFHMSHKMIEGLMKCAGSHHVEILDPVKLTRDHGRFQKGGMLSHLEQNLFRPDATAYHDTDTDVITIGRCATLTDELLYAASQIREIVRTRGLRYRDCGVICANLEDYKNYAQQVFSSYDVPIYLDTNSDIVFHPLTEFIRSAFAMVTEDFSEESVMHHLRSGLSVLSEEEADTLETYIHAKGIRGMKAYQRPFTAVPKSLRTRKNAKGEDVTAEERTAYMMQMNEIRSKLMAAWNPFLAAVSGGEHTVREFSTALYGLLMAHDVEARLSGRADQEEADGEAELADRDRRVFGIVMGVLDEMVSLLDQEMVSAEEYDEILEAGMSAISFGTIPPSMDSVVIGDMERTRLDGIRVLFLIGASDASIPGALSSGGIISQMEREKLKDANFELAPTDKERAFMKRFYIYLALTKPSDKLFITYARLDASGRSLRQSYLISTLLKLFPDLEIRNLEALAPIDYMITPVSARRYLIDLLRGYAAGELELNDPEDARTKTVSALTAWMEENSGRQDELNHLLDAAFYRHPKEKISETLMQVMAADTIGGSVTRLENYASCPYSYFLRYGLRLQDLEEPVLASVDRGTIYHEVLEKYSTAVQEAGLTWHEISAADSVRILQEAEEASRKRIEEEASHLLEDGRQSHELERMNRTLERTVWALTGQVRAGKFEPAAFELNFSQLGYLDSMHFTLEDGGEMSLGGKIDRVDLCRLENELLVRIIDYKSGSTKLDFQKMYYGLQIQLVLYMTAALEGMSRQNPGLIIRPAAMNYYNIADPLVEVKGATEEDAVNASAFHSLMLDGISNTDNKILEAEDTALGPDADGTYPASRSDVIAVARNKNGSLRKSDKNVEDAAFDVMGRYVHRQIEHTGSQIRRGVITASPYRMGNQSGCDYCPYHTICGFDSRLDGFSYRRLADIDGNIIAKMQKDLEDKPDSDQQMAGGQQ